MNIETALNLLLKADAGVAGVVSTRVFTGVLPQDVTYPAIVCRPLGDRERIRTLNGGCGLFFQRMSVFSACNQASGGYRQATRADEAAMRALDEFTGTVSNAASPPDSLEIQAIFADRPNHRYEYVDGTKTHEFLSAFKVFYVGPDQSA